MTVTVYSAPDCVQCHYTVKELVSKGIHHNVIDVSTNPGARKVVEDTGITQLPYVVTDDDAWHGFKIEKLRGLSAKDS